MKTLVKLIIAAVLSAASLQAFAAAGTRPVQSFVAGSIDMREVKKTMRIYAVYEGENEITVALRQRITDLGYPLVENQENADIVFKVSRIYSGKASGRPKAGTYDGVSNRDGISVARLLGWIALGAAMDARLAPGMTRLQTIDVTNFWSDSLKDGGVFNEIEHNFKPTKKPQDAVVSRIELTVNGITQTADVVSQSYAKDVPDVMIAGENLRQVAWYLE